MQAHTLIFGRISGPMVTEHADRILVGDLQDSQIYVFSADGLLTDVFGDQGQGPGEFEMLAGM